MIIFLRVFGIRSPFFTAFGAFRRHSPRFLDAAGNDRLAWSAGRNGKGPFALAIRAQSRRSVIPAWNLERRLSL